MKARRSVEIASGSNVVGSLQIAIVLAHSEHSMNHTDKISSIIHTDNRTKQ